MGVESDLGDRRVVPKQRRRAVRAARVEAHPPPPQDCGSIHRECWRPPRAACLTRAAMLVLVGALVTTPALADITRSPLPVLVAGKKTYHVYSVSGVGGKAGGDLGTYFSCTSTDSVPMQVAVEIFNSSGGSGCPLSPTGCAPINNAVTTSLSVDGGETVMFGTCSGAWISVDSDLGGCDGTFGSARILSTSKKLICTAFLVASR
jgi:hypothetical protein